MSPPSFRVNPHSIACLNVKELLAWSRRHIWSLSDSNGIRTHNHLVRKRTLNHLAKLAKWLSCLVSTYLYGAFDCMLLSCHVRMTLVSLKLKQYFKKISKPIKISKNFFKTLRIHLWSKVDRLRTFNKT